MVSGDGEDAQGRFDFSQNRRQLPARSRREATVRDVPGQKDEIRLQLLLDGMFAAGGLRGRDARAAFFARCDRSTMTESDIAQGRVIAEVGFAPALTVERLRVRLALGAGAPTLLAGGTA